MHILRQQYRQERKELDKDSSSGNKEKKSYPRGF
jgi:hypothetical protein